jgi:glycerol-3-phosphate dehydrogenase (NAD(P)+)
VNVKVAVIGAGSWGTALAVHLAGKAEELWLWDHRAERAEEMERSRENVRYLPGRRFPDQLRVTGDLEAALRAAPLVVSAVPAQSVREVLGQARGLLDPDAAVCCASKGIESGTLLTMEEVLHEVLPGPIAERTSFLAGPCFAKELAAGVPSGVVVAGRNTVAVDRMAEALHHGMVRAWHTEDIVGAELGGALKNVIAIACGVADGMGFGLNTRAAVITRGLHEITRLAVARGGNPLTLAGLAGVGDLVLTCTGDLSRNRRVGLGLGQGKRLDQILAELGQVAEGVMTAESAHQLAQRSGVEMPITAQIFFMLYEGKPVAEVMKDLTGRQRKAERG